MPFTPPPGSVLGIDASYSRITKADFKKFKARGYQVFAQDVWTGIAHPNGIEHCYANLYDGLDTGMITAAYNVINGSMPGGWHIDKGREAIQDLWPYMRFIAIDVEVPGTRVESCLQAEDRVREFARPPWLYSGRWFWTEPIYWGDGADNPTALSHLPLWWSYYDYDPDYDFQRMPFGGWDWDKVAGEQFSGTYQAPGLEGIQVDLNVFKTDFIYPEEERIMRRHIAESQWYKDAYARGDSWAPGVWEVQARKDFNLRESDRRVLIEVDAFPAGGDLVYDLMGYPKGAIVLLDSSRQPAGVIPPDGRRHQIPVWIDGGPKGKFFLWVAGGSSMRIRRVGCAEAG